MAEKKSKTARTSKLPTVQELLEAGVHFGHETQRWDPRFREFIFSKRGGFHIIDLEKTLEKLGDAVEFLEDAAKKGKEIIMVGTKRQAREIVREQAIRSGAHFVVNRWVGGQITNFDTVGKGIKGLRDVEEKLSGDISEYTPYELAVLRREWGRLDRLFGGVKQLNKQPDVIVVIDAHFENIAIKEAKKAGIPIVAVVDSNTDHRGIQYPIPANDDAINAVQLLVTTLADAISAGNKGKGVKHEFTDFSKIGVEPKSDKSSAKDELETPDKEDEASEDTKKEEEGGTEASKKTKSSKKKAAGKRKAEKKKKKNSTKASKTKKKSTKKKTSSKKKTKSKKKE